jgi:hypothetical protein
VTRRGTRDQWTAEEIIAEVIRWADRQGFVCKAWKRCLFDKSGRTRKDQPILTRGGCRWRNYTGGK